MAGSQKMQEQFSAQKGEGSCSDVSVVVVKSPFLVPFRIIPVALSIDV
jgi:hypothetical protein